MVTATRPEQAARFGFALRVSSAPAGGGALAFQTTVSYHCFKHLFDSPDREATPLNDTSLTDPTRERLLQAAGRVFAEKGFRDATVREICRRAEVNVAAVNYHFRGKEALYGEALAYAYREADARYPLALGGGGAEERLRHYVGNFLRRLLDQSHLGWYGRLIAREIAEPSAVLDGFVASALVPAIALLQNIIAELLEADASHNDIRRCALSVLGQCLMYRHARAVIERTCPELIAGPEEIERTVEHIVNFSLAALRGPR